MRSLEKMAGADQRVDPFLARINARFDELTRQVDAIAESWREDRRKLYDLFRVCMHCMEARTDALAVTLRAEMKLGYDALDSRVTVLERRGSAGRRRR